MSDTDNDQKTQDASEKRLEDARQRGEVPIAPEVRQAVMLAAILASLLWVGARTAGGLLLLSRELWGGADLDLDASGGSTLAWRVVGELIAAIGPALLLLVAAAVLGGVAQGRLLFSAARLKPRFDKLLPWKGLARMFGKAGMVEFAKTLAKSAAVVFVSWHIAGPRLADLERLVGADPAAIGNAALGLSLRIVSTVAIAVAALALFDFAWQRFSFLRSKRMTLQEVKDEHKESEGDPKIKARVRQIQAQRARQRMMAAVPGAAVVVTNPTHYAVALKYEHGTMNAPTVVAKGVDAIALKIREVAAAHGVPILESPPLARALHATVEIDHPIRAEHYAAVAEIISQVLKLARRH